MVATRRGARTDPTQDSEPSQLPNPSKRQKPSRNRAPSTSTVTKTTAKEEQDGARSTRSRATMRSQKVNAQSASRTGRAENTADQTEEEQSQRPLNNQVDRATIGGSLRSRKTADKVHSEHEKSGISATLRAQKKDPVQHDHSLQTRGSTRSSKAAVRSQSKGIEHETSTRSSQQDEKHSAKAKGLSGRVMEQASVERATTTPGAVSRVSKARANGSRTTQKKPLSPKKVTQVTRKANNNSEPASQLSHTSEATTTARTRRSARNTVSDENAPLPGKVDKVDLPEPATIPVVSPKVRSTGRRIQLRANTPESDLSMSSRPTTPSDSPAPNFEQPKNLSEDRADSKEALESSNIDLDDHEQDQAPQISGYDLAESEDELAGPKTPMRRTRRAAAKTKSAKQQATVRSRKQAATKPLVAGSPVVSISSEAADPSIVPVTDHLVSQRTDRDTVARSQEQTGDALLDTGDGAQIPDDSLFDDEEMFPHIPDDLKGENTYHGFDVVVEKVEEHGDAGHEDLNETIVVEDEEHGQDLPTSENSVVKHPETQIELDTKTVESEKGVAEEEAQDVTEMVDDDIDDDYTRLSVNPKTPRPQTINWYQVEPNTALRNTLDLGLSPNADQSQFGILPDEVHSSSTTKGSIEDLHQQLADDNDDEEIGNQTVEFTEFITMSGATDAPGVQDGTTTPQFDPSHATPVSQSRRLPPSTVVPTEGAKEDSRPNSEVAVSRPEAITSEPHYMQSTLAFDARRKSLPARMLSTPVRCSARPNTSDGAGTWSTSHGYEGHWSTKSRPQSQATAYQIRATLTPNRVRRSLAPFATSTPKTAKVPIATHGEQVTPRRVLPRQIPNTVAGYSRFSTATTLGAPTIRDSLRRAVFDADRKMMSRSPARTPLRSITGTPGVVAMTPHPAMPLRGVLAIVEVYTCEGASASAPFVALLHRLGAKTTKIWSDRVTHVIFKDGSPTTLQRVALHNKRVVRTGSGHQVHCVNSRWVSDSDSQGTRVLESDEAYAVSTDGLTGSAKRKRKSMEPTPMVNVDGSLVRDRQGSWGRSSSGRFKFGDTPSRTGSPSPFPDSIGAQMPADALFDKNIGDITSPATPVWIAAPNRLIQATAPVKRIKRRAPVGAIKLPSRRLTQWNNV